MLNEQQKKVIIDRLTERVKKMGRGFRCPMCGNEHFVLLDSYLRNDIQEDLTSVMLGGPSIPAAAIVCSNCGFISQHALGVLGLMPSHPSPTPEPKGGENP